ncbi:MAG TPA: FAD-dependent oxidoreductase [Gemmatimonadales bacterium]|nr:FAD-dependent oxidoreductase [Gemmatimonadales bacterium]
MSSHATTGRRPPVVVIGAGPTGLSAAYHLGADALLIEGRNEVGGWCRSIEDGGFTFDYAGHIMFTNDPYVLQLYELLLGDNVHWQDREAWIYSKQTYTRYPFQGALYGLPPEVIKECIVGAIEARFGSLNKPRLGEGAADQGDYTGPERRGMFEPLLRKQGDVAGSVLSGYHGGERRRPPLTKGPPRNFEEFIYKVWGAGIARHFAIPYNEKLWAVPLSEMETSWLGGRVPLPNLEEMIDGALSPVGRPMGPNARFGYPLRGGFQALMDGFLPHLRGELLLGTRVLAISPKQRKLRTSDGRTHSYDQLISTMPLPALVDVIGHEAPAEVQAAARALKHVSVRCVNIGIGREALTEKHWIYYPEDTVFHRIFVQGNASPYCNPPGGFGLTCEITYSDAKPLPCEGEALIARCIQDCIRVGMFTADDPVICANQVDMPVAYVVYDHERAANVNLIRDWVSGYDIILAGRYSEWEYYNSDHAFIAGKKAADQAVAAQQEQFMAFPRSAALSER